VLHLVDNEHRFAFHNFIISNKADHSARSPLPRMIRGSNPSQPILIDDDWQPYCALKEGWDKLSAEIKLQIMRWVLQASHSWPSANHYIFRPWSREDFSPSIKENRFNQVLRPWLGSGSEMGDIAKTAFWEVNTFLFEADLGTHKFLTPISSLCRFLRHLSIWIDLDPEEFNNMRCLANSGKLDNVKHCDIKVNCSTNRYFDMEETRRISADALVLSTKTAITRWVGCVHPEGSDPIKLPGTVTFDITEFCFDSPCFSIRGGDIDDIESAFSSVLEKIISNLFIFKDQNDIDSPEARSAKINAILQESLF
jgi:hypothetical protein